MTEPSSIQTLVAMADEMAIGFSMHALGITRPEALARREKQRKEAAEAAALFRSRFLAAPIVQGKGRMVERRETCDCCHHEEVWHTLVVECPACHEARDGGFSAVHGFDKAPDLRADFLCKCGTRVQLTEYAARNLEAPYAD